MKTNLSAKRKFVVAFNRDRDGYQVPLALHSVGMLQVLVTDFYASDHKFVRGFTPKRLRHRNIAGLPRSMVRTSPVSVLMQAYTELRRARATGWYMQVDARLSRMAADSAADSSADLFLYAQYAQEAFSDRRLANRLKTLFVFHPHAGLSTQILAEDAQNYPECGGSLKHAIEIDDRELLSRLDSEIKLADFFFCASSFTLRSLVHHGVDPQRITVVPYGTNPTTVSETVARDSSTTRFLYVGQGVQRKGLHHLLRAWKQARPQNSILRIICSQMDPNFEPLLDQPGIEFSRAVSRAELLTAFSSAHIFVMPSLVEGFGLVYLEALSAGCFVIATPNTGVPDLGLPEEMAIIVEPADLAQLREALNTAQRLQADQEMDHNAISRFASSLSWDAFRQRLVSCIDDLPRRSPGPKPGIAP
jgi:glycosyltransferase involved in cell wall biosynthesis